MQTNELCAVSLNDSDSDNDDDDDDDDDDARELTLSILGLR